MKYFQVIPVAKTWELKFCNEKLFISIFSSICVERENIIKIQDKVRTRNTMVVCGSLKSKSWIYSCVYILLYKSYWIFFVNTTLYYFYSHMRKYDASSIVTLNFDLGIILFFGFKIVERNPDVPQRWTWKATKITRSKTLLLFMELGCSKMYV